MNISNTSKQMLQLHSILFIILNNKIIFIEIIFHGIYNGKILSLDDDIDTDLITIQEAHMLSIITLNT